MTDVMERLAAANPVTELERPSIDDVWRKLDTRERRGGGSRLRTYTARWAVVLAAVAVPLAVLAAIAIPLLARGHGSRGASDRLSPAHHAPTPRPTASASLLDPRAQRSARRALGAQSGSVVALDPRTGRVLAALGQINDTKAPEATVDVLTAALALDRGTTTPSARIFAPARLPGSPVSNNQGASYGRMTVGQALSFSVNTVFGRLGEELGGPTVAQYMSRFGLLPSALGDAAVLASGQGDVKASPLALASVAATIANGGVRVTPRMATGDPTVSRRLMSAATARVIQAALAHTVENGTASSASVNGLTVAGKTGTAQFAGGTLDWFIGYAPAAHPAVAVAVLVTGGRGGYGGTVAAPVAARFLRQFLLAR